MNDFPLEEASRLVDLLQHPKTVEAVRAVHREVYDALYPDAAMNPEAADAGDGPTRSYEFKDRLQMECDRES